MFDGLGLYLELAPSVGRWWRFKYRGGKEKRISLGVFPDVSLAQAREARDDLRNLVAAGIDPSERRKADKRAVALREANSFQEVVLGWQSKHGATPLVISAAL